MQAAAKKLIVLDTAGIAKLIRRQAIMRVKVLFTTLLFCLAALDLHAQPIEFIVAYEDTEQPPYQLGNTEEISAKPGVSVEMVMMLTDFLPDLKIGFRRVPWNRCLRELEAGRVDATFNASFREERLKFGAYPIKDGQPDESRRIATLSYSLYKLRGSDISWDGEKIINLNGKIGAPAGYSIIDDLRKMGVPVDEAQTTRANLLQLQYRRVAAVAAQDVTADELLKNEASTFKDIIKVEPPLVSKAYYMMISHQFIKKHPALAEKIWDTLAKIREERMADLLEKYMD